MTDPYIPKGFRTTEFEEPETFSTSEGPSGFPIPSSKAADRVYEVKNQFIDLMTARRWDEALLVIREVFPTADTVTEETDHVELQAQGIIVRWSLNDAAGRLVGIVDFLEEEAIRRTQSSVDGSPEAECADVSKARRQMTWKDVESVESQTLINYSKWYERFATVVEQPQEDDAINHPSHYTQYQGVEVIDITRKLSFNRGNAVKYIARAGFKSNDTELQDLKKALWYIENTQKNVRDEVKFPDLLSYNEVQILVGQMTYNRGTAVWNLALAGDLRAEGDIRNLEWTKNINEAKYAIKEEIKRLESYVN